MKKFIYLITILTVIFAFTACSEGAISGDLQTYYNPDKSFSIDLPTAGEDAWIVNAEAKGNILDATDKGDTVTIYVQGLSKLQAGAAASDLASYKDYSIMNTFSDVLTSVELSDTSVEVPDFIVESSAGTFTYEGAKGMAVFMESEKSYYTYFIMAVDDAYTANEKMLLESIMSFKEVSEVE